MISRKGICLLQVFRWALVLSVSSLGLLAIIASAPEEIDLPEEAKDAPIVFSLAIDDLDGDGALDLIFPRQDIKYDGDDFSEENNVSVILQNTTLSGTFFSEKDYPVGQYPICAATGDLNDDGFPDLVTSNTDGDNVSILFQDVANPGNFSPAIYLVTGPDPQYVAIGDINGDGLNDIAVVDSGLSLFFQDSNSVGTFLPRVALGVTSEYRPSSIAIKDLNGDQLADLIVTAVTVHILLQELNKPGTFQPEKIYSAAGRAYAVSIDDIDGDLLPDLAVAANNGTYEEGYTGGVSVLLQNAANPGNFLSAVYYPIGYRCFDIDLGDLNGDGLMDVLVANTTFGGNGEWGIIHFLFQNSAAIGTFLAPVKNVGIYDALAVAIGDLNADGLNDIAISDAGVRIRLQDSSSPGQFMPPIKVSR